MSNHSDQTYQPSEVPVPEVQQPTTANVDPTEVPSVEPNTGTPVQPEPEMSQPSGEETSLLSDESSLQYYC